MAPPNNLEFEKELFEQNYKYIAGIDEAGRGPLAGPLVVAAVILNLDHILATNNTADLETDYKTHDRNNDVEYGIFRLYKEINDSKLISKNKRKRLHDFIIENAVSYSIIEIDSKAIDSEGIANANKIGFSQALSKLSVKPHYIITDFFKLHDEEYENFQVNLVKGDRLSISVAAASILAKVHRDEHMQKLHTYFPQFAFDKNKGYPTKYHKEMLALHGPCVHHRKSFNLGIDSSKTLMYS